MKSNKHRWKDIAREQKKNRRQSNEENSAHRDQSGSSERTKWKRRKQHLKDMSIDDLRQYVIDTEYDPE